MKTPHGKNRSGCPTLNFRVLCESLGRVFATAGKYSKITAPFDGVVGRRSVHEAQGVKKGDALVISTLRRRRSKSVNRMESFSFSACAR